MTRTEKVAHEVMDRHLGKAADERQMWQWYTMLPESERKAILRFHQNCIKFGLTVSSNLLPEPAKEVVRLAYAQHLIHVAELEAQYPAQ